MTAHFFADTATLTGRSLKHITRSPDTIITTAVMPIAIMLLFVYVLGGAIETGPASGTARYIDYMLPGIPLITVAMGVSYTGYRLFTDLDGGIFDRFVLALTRVAVIAGLSATSIEGATVFSYPLIFLPFISSAFVPTESMPGPVRWFAQHQPVTSIVNTIRDLFTGRPVGGDLWIALAWCLGILVVAHVAAMRIHRRRIS